MHSCILQLLGGEIDWNAHPNPFSSLPEEVLGTILYFLYAECLPDTLTEVTAKQVIEIASQHPCLLKLVNMCHVYLKNMALKQRKSRGFTPGKCGTKMRVGCRNNRVGKRDARMRRSNNRQLPNQQARISWR